VCAAGASLGTVRKWERGERSPSGAARMLVRILARDPALVIAEAGLAEKSRRFHRRLGPKRGCGRSLLLGSSPFVGMSPRRLSHAFHQRLGMGVQFTRPRNGFRLSWKHRARPLGIRPPNRIVALRSTLHEQAILVHSGSPSPNSRDSVLDDLLCPCDIHRLISTPRQQPSDRNVLVDFDPMQTVATDLDFLALTRLRIEQPRKPCKGNADRELAL
jgi:hypothetical protein